MDLKISNNLKKTNNGGSPFHRPTDEDLAKKKTKEAFTSNSLEEKAQYFANEMTVEEMKEYVKRHTSGIKLDTSLCSAGGGRIATFEKFVEMVQDGYNIEKATVLGYNMIDVVFQKKNDNNMQMGGR